MKRKVIGLVAALILCLLCSLTVDRQHWLSPTGIEPVSAFDGKEFVVQDSGASAEYYAKGTLLRVSGKITALDKRRILLLDSAGTPGWPNVIKIEKLK